MFVILSCLHLFTNSQSTVIPTYFSILSSYDTFESNLIFWPQTFTSTVIVPSSNYASSASSISIYFNIGKPNVDLSTPTPSSGLPTLYYALFNYPGGKLTTCVYIVKDNLLNGDFHAVCPLSIISAGVYGPIYFVIKSGSIIGPVVAMEVALGYFALLSGSNPTPTGNLLNVNFSPTPTTTSTYVISTAQTLSFLFNTTVALYKNDYFVLTPDYNWVYNKAALTLAWDSTNAGSINFNNSMTYITNNTAGTQVYIFGLANQVVSGTTVSFTLTGFSTPGFAMAASSFSWSLSLNRFGVNTILAIYGGTGPTTAVSAGVITVTSWAPVNSALSTSIIVNGMVAWFKLSFNCAHAIPPNGLITLTIATSSLCSNTYQIDAGTQTAAEIGSTFAGCGAYTDSTLSLSIISLNVMTLTNTGIIGITAATNINIYNLITLSNGLSISSIVLLDELGYNTIDTYTANSFATITLPSNGIALLTTFMASPVVGYMALNQYSTINTAHNNGFLIQFRVPETVSAAPTVTVNVPVTIGTSASASSLTFSPTVFSLFQTASTGAALTSFTSSSTPTTTLPTISSNTIAFTSSDSGFTSGNVVEFYLGSGTVASPTALYTPLLPTVLSNSPQEVIIKMQISTTLYIYSQPLYFTSGAFMTTPNLAVACLNANYGGIPAMLTVTPVAYTVPSGYTVSIFRI